MNYSALIENRKSVRAFTEKKVSFADLEQVQAYYRNSVRRLVPEIATQLYFFGPESGAALEGAAGYNRFLVGAPQYLVLMSEGHELAHLNGGYVMEDLILKLTDLDLDSCWLTFADSEDVKAVLGIESEMDVVAMAAFGYGAKMPRRPRINIRSMSNVDIRAKRQYVEPKKSVRDITFVNEWGNNNRIEDYIGFFGDMLWEALHAASLAPSYLNRQAYGFLIRNGSVSLVSAPDAYTTEPDGQLSLGVVLHHFTAVAENWAGRLNWKFGGDDAEWALPEGYRVIASCAL